MMRRRMMWCLLSLLAAAVSCKKSSDDISFRAPSKQYDLSVEGGMLTTFTQSIRLTRPALSPDSTPQPISNASVVVNDSKVNLVFRETSPGIYSYNNDARINPPNYNQPYKLTITYKGKTYTAVDTLRQVVNIIDDFLPFTVSKGPDGSYNGTIPRHTFGYLNPSKWWITYKGIPPWIQSRLTEGQYYTYTHFLGSPNSLYPLTNLKRTFNLGPDDTITIIKLSLSQEYAKYLYSVFLETDWNGLFSSIPTNVKGNISGNAQGYFSVSDVDTRTYTLKELR